MGGHFLIYLCVLLWGVSNFLNRLSVERISPFIMQAIIGMVYVLYIPIAFKLSGESFCNYKFSGYSLILTSLATISSIFANILLYSSLKGNSHSGATTMFVSLYPVVTLILSFFFLHEELTITKLLGVLAMMLGAYLLSI